MRMSKAEVKYLRSLSQKKVRDKEGKFVLEGWRALKEALNSGYKIDYVAVLPKFLEDGDYAKLLGEIRSRKIEVKEIGELELKAVSGTVHSQGVVALVEERRFELSLRTIAQAKVVVAADAVSDPGNLGSILRTCDWFGVDLVILGKGCVELYNEKVVRSTAGSIFHLQVLEGVDLIEALPQMRSWGFSIVALSGDAKVSYDEHKFAEKSVLVLGSEAHGLSKQVRSVVDASVKIPKFGHAESLNVGVACGIVLAHLKNSLRLD